MNTNSNNKTAIAIIAGLFFIFGFITWVNGALIPFMKTINELTEAQSYLVASASYISFVVMALPVHEKETIARVMNGASKSKNGSCKQGD